MCVHTLRCVSLKLNKNSAKEEKRERGGGAGKGTREQWKVSPFSEAFEVFIPILWFRFCIASLLLFRSFLRFLLSVY